MKAGVFVSGTCHGRHCSHWRRGVCWTRAAQPAGGSDFLPEVGEREGQAAQRQAHRAEDAPGRAAHERDLEQARATQAKLVALRADVPTHARLEETDLAQKLVSHCPDFKLLVDAVRAACHNAESDLAARLAPHMKRPEEAKKILANVFASPGEVRVYATGITVALDCAANAGERAAIAALLAEITAAKLTLPGDPAQRPLTFRAQPVHR